MKLIHKRIWRWQEGRYFRNGWTINRSGEWIGWLLDDCFGLRLIAVIEDQSDAG